MKSCIYMLSASQYKGLKQMNKVYALPFVNKVRLTKHLLKNYWKIFFMYMVVAGIAIAYISSGPMLQLLLKLPFAKYTHILKAAVIVVSCKIFLLPKKPGYLINHATLFNFYHHKCLKVFFNLLYVKKAITLLLAAGFLAFIINNLSFGTEYAVFVIVFWLFFYPVSLLSWGKYNASKSASRLITTAFLANAILFYCLHAWYVLPGLLVTLAAVIGLNRRFTLNYSKYMSSLSFIDEANAAVSKADYARMAQIQNLARSGVKRSVYLPMFPINEGNVFSQKTIIRLFREPKGVWIVVLLPYAALLVLRAIYGGVFCNPYLLALSLNMAIAAVNQFFVKDFTGLIVSRAKGMNLPYPNKRLILLTLPVPAIVFAVASIFIGVNLLTPFWKIGLHFLVTLGTFMGLCIYTLEVGYPSRMLLFLQNLVITLATLWLV